MSRKTCPRPLETILSISCLSKHQARQTHLYIVLAGDVYMNIRWVDIQVKDAGIVKTFYPLEQSNCDAPDYFGGNGRFYPVDTNSRMLEHEDKFALSLKLNVTLRKKKSLS